MKRLMLVILVLLLGAVAAHGAITSTSVTLSWTLATDPDNAQPTLRYEVCQAAANTIATVTGCEAATIVQPFTANIATATVNGLTPATTLWFNVVVTDPAGNKAAYVPLSVTTLPDTTPPVPGNNGILTAQNFAGPSIELSWIPASDPDDDSHTLRYEICQSLANNIATVAACEAALVQAFATNIMTFTATGLKPSTLYHFNVVVADGANNKAVYVPLAKRTRRYRRDG